MKYSFFAPLAAYPECVMPHQNSGGIVDHEKAGAIPPVVLEPIRNTSLFYPCSGDDLELPISLFASVLSDFYFVDIRKPRRPRVGGVPLRRAAAPKTDNYDDFVHAASGNAFRVHRLQQRAETFLDDLSSLGVFFFRGDNPVEGEGSSGILWLGHDLLSRVLPLLVPGGLIVTDGSNPDPGEPTPFSAFYHRRNVGPEAMSASVPFEFGGRTLRCVAYVGEKNGPTLVWTAA